MPYVLVGNCVHKQKEDGSASETVPGGCHDTPEEAKRHMRALYANVKESGIVEMSLRITKASFNKSESHPMKWAAIDSDIDEDLYKEKMSLELYKDFIHRIENKVPVPEPFQDVICESDWCGGVPYLSIAHYKAGSGLSNVPGTVESVFIDGTRLKSKGTLNDTPMGRKVFDALREDLYMEKSQDHLPVRISIGFLDLEHAHRPDDGGQEFVFTRSDVGQICPLCEKGIGGKIYRKGQLVHLAMTRVPVNPRTEMSVERSMEITTKRDDAKSIIGELADELEEKSIATDMLVVRADETGNLPTPDSNELTVCYDANVGTYDQNCINRIMEKYLPKIRDEVGQPVKSKSLPKEVLDAAMAYLYKSNGYDVPVVEDAMDKPITETPAEVPAPVVETPVVPVAKSDAKEEAKEKEEGTEKDEKVKEMSALDKVFAQLKDTVASKDVDAVNKAFAALGTEVEKAFTPEPSAVNPADLAEIVKSAVEQAVAPLRLELATLKAQAGNVPAAPSGPVVKSKALTIGGYTRPEDMIQRAVQTAPTKKLSQIEQLARRSTGLRD